MPRFRAFDPDTALDAVVDVFWRQGFSATNYDDLVAASGVSRKGLYTAFGDKEALFVAALARYRETVGRAILVDLDKPDVTIADVAGAVARLGKKVATPMGRKGCLLANTAADDTLALPAVKAQVDRHLRDMSRTFATALARAGLPAERSATLGDYLTGVLQGLFLLAHARAAKPMIDNYVTTALAALE